MPAHSNLGLIRMMNGDFAGAEVHVRRIIQLAPNDYRSYVNMADLRISQERYDEAKMYYERALEIEPANKDIAMILQLGAE